ncbi:MAG: hypothetical protein ACP5I1_13220, partial [Candidatus Hinthialibacter sp.]
RRILWRPRRREFIACQHLCPMGPALVEEAPQTADRRKRFGKAGGFSIHFIPFCGEGPASAGRNKDMEVF